MAVSNIIAGKGSANLRRDTARKLYKNSKEFRADRLVEHWARVPELGEGLTKLSENKRRNCAMNLEQEATFMSKLNESVLSRAVADQKPENMLRLIRLAMPSVIRDELFTEIALESARDSIKYFRPTVARPFNKEYTMKNRHTNGYEEDDPWGMDNDNDFNGDSYQRSLYEQSEDRFTQETANAKINPSGDIVVNGKTVEIPAGLEGTVIAFTGDEFELGYIDGYVTIFGKDAQDTIAIQNKASKEFFLNTKDHPEVAEVVTVAEGVYVLKAAEGETLPAVVKAFGRYDSETDFDGNYMGELQLKMSTHDFDPRPTFLGISFSSLAEVTMEASFGIAVDDQLLQYGAQEIKTCLDRQAIKLAYANAKTNPKQYTVEFDAGWYASATPDSNQKRGYLENAQTFNTAIYKVSDVMLNDIKRGGVSKIVGGPSAVSYMSLISGFNADDDVSFVGPHKFGSLNNIDVFKVPSDLIPTDTLLCIWKNDKAEGDVAVVFGTLIPFLSSGLIRRKNMYTEASLCTIGDYAVLNRRYLSLIKIKNLKDTTEV